MQIGSYNNIEPLDIIIVDDYDIILKLFLIEPDIYPPTLVSITKARFKDLHIVILDHNETLCIEAD